MAKSRTTYKNPRTSKEVRGFLSIHGIENRIAAEAHSRLPADAERFSEETIYRAGAAALSGAIEMSGAFGKG